jgi:curved DNA-binding protein CbpA
MSAFNNIFASKNTNKYSFLDKAYEILNSGPGNSIEQISVEYRKLAKDLHPDKNKELEVDSEGFTEIQKLNVCYDLMKDSELREKYNNWLRSSLVIPFVTWMNLPPAAQSLHWSKPDTTKWLKEGVENPELKPSKDKIVLPVQIGKSAIDQFRNYEI